MFSPTVTFQEINDMVQNYGQIAQALMWFQDRLGETPMSNTDYIRATTYARMQLEPDKFDENGQLYNQNLY